MNGQVYRLSPGLMVGGGRDQIDFEAGMMEPDWTPAPVRVIEITDEIRAEDAAKQAAREQPVHAWSIKSELSVDNLRRKAPVRKPAAAAKTRVRKPCPKKPTAPIAAIPIAPEIVSSPTESTMTTTIPAASAERTDHASATSTTERTTSTIQTKKTSFEEVLAAHFGEVEESDSAEPEVVHLKPVDLQPNTAEVEHLAHAPAQILQPAAPEPKYCLTGCGRTLRSNNTTQFCFQCNTLAARAAKIPPRTQCTREGCTKLQRNGAKKRADGLCGYHGSLADKVARGGQFQKKLEKLGRKCTGCEKLIGPTSKSGKCRDCARNKFRTVLFTESREEFELNELWGALSLDDRWAVLQDALG